MQSPKFWPESQHIYFITFEFSVSTCRERNTLQRANRRLEKKLKEMAVQAENERVHADQYKEQVMVMVTIFYSELWIMLDSEDSFLISQGKHML